VSRPGPEVVVDDRIGSGEIAPILRGLSVPVRLDRLEAADFAFEGQGPKGSCMVGIERKRLRDLIQCIHSGRFEGEQLPKMAQTYAQCWLIVEGIWRPNPQSGVLEEATGGGWREVLLAGKGMAYCQIDNFLTSLQARAHLLVKFSQNAETTAHIVKGMWNWYRKPWSQHKAGLVLYQPPPPAALWVKPSLVRKVAAQLEGIGWEKSIAVAQRFRSVLDMVVATEGDWRQIPGIGKQLARRAVDQLLGRDAT